jgi:hypothetical protein
MAEMPWRDAIVTVLKASGSPMHYAEIAQAIIDNEYRVNVGATPAVTVAANLSESIRSEKRSPFVKVERGVYALRDTSIKPVGREAAESDEAKEDARQMGLINAFGMFWDRSAVHWRPTMTHLLGVQQSGCPGELQGPGVYVLYDGSRAIYLGRVIEPRLGQRLFEHTRNPPDRAVEPLLLVWGSRCAGRRGAADTDRWD